MARTNVAQHGRGRTSAGACRCAKRWLTDVVFHHLRPLLGSKVLIGGDFNASRLLDKPSEAGGTNAFFDRIAEDGFVSLHRQFHEGRRSGSR